MKALDLEKIHEFIQNFVGIWGMGQALFSCLFFSVKSRSKEGLLTAALYLLLLFQILRIFLFTQQYAFGEYFKWVFLYSDIITIGLPLFLYYYVHVLMQIPLGKYKIWYMVSLAITVPLHFSFISLFRTDFWDIW